MIRSHHTKAGSFSCAGEKFSTLAEAGCCCRIARRAELGEMTVGFRFRKRIRSKLQQVQAAGPASETQ